jgi:dedicated sortase system histidine kinase
MTLKRQLLLVSLLALMLPWAGCEFIRETESTLRSSQQQMLAGLAQATARSMTQHAEEFPARIETGSAVGDQLYGHPLEVAPEVDGYFEDWPLDAAAPRELRGGDGPIQLVAGVADEYVFLYLKVPDRDVVYADATMIAGDDRDTASDGITIFSISPQYLNERFTFFPAAPGTLVPFRRTPDGISPEPAVRAFWRDVPKGYQFEARVPLSMFGTHIGITVNNAASDGTRVPSSSFTARIPGLFVTPSAELERIAGESELPGMRMIVVDSSGWRIATLGALQTPAAKPPTPVSFWLQFAYEALVEPGREAVFAEPDPGGREQQSYIAAALDGEARSDWFRSADSGRAIVAAAAPVIVNGETIGAIVLQQGTDAILSLTNQGLARLMTVTMITMLVVAGALIGYASLLSRRIRKLSVAAEQALESDRMPTLLPSSGASDEIGDLSRSFAYVLGQLGDYNEYLRSLASKLSHELRTPLAIVTSSLENLEHEKLDEASAGYTARAKDGADRLRAILSAMSEASRVEELMQNAEPENFELDLVLETTVAAYQDVYEDRDIIFACTGDDFPTSGSPELLIQMLDKLVDNAVSFSSSGDTVMIRLSNDTEARTLPRLRLDVENPGPPLPERMRSQLFDSMVSMRGQKDNKHLGLGLYVAKLIAEGHNGTIDAENIESGVRFSVWLPGSD